MLTSTVLNSAKPKRELVPVMRSFMSSTRWRLPLVAPMLESTVVDCTLDLPPLELVWFAGASSGSGLYSFLTPPASNLSFTWGSSLRNRRNWEGVAETSLSPFTGSVGE